MTEVHTDHARVLRPTIEAGYQSGTDQPRRRQTATKEPLECAARERETGVSRMGAAYSAVEVRYRLVG